ncbi:hypothetical protein [Streptomyces sp. NPDC012746]|uniref:hypothetical protein n=1 Tax=Streptomyces sp. NPDC012746 TaxID=3364845 RepID=UPI0036B007D8
MLRKNIPAAVVHAEDGEHVRQSAREVSGRLQHWCQSAPASSGADLAVQKV